MIPQIRETSAVQALYLRFLGQLKKNKFKGEISPDYANRTVLSTDNSIYQVLPQGVVYPRDTEDLITLGALVRQKEFHGVVLSARGGGTGTNGQSLTDGLVVDVSRHMNQILEINQAEGWVRVQAGVVKDQLNSALKRFGLFFAPELSTSNRATIGGMINTDASGQGSCLYGKTRDHVIELTTVLLDGLVLHSHALNEAEFKSRYHQQDRVGLTHRLVSSIAKENSSKIQNSFPKLNRCLTGYDLAHIYDDDGRFNINNILCGSEGTLGFICEAKLRVLAIPKETAVALVQYTNFNASLRDATRLMSVQPGSIETIDSRVLHLAKSDNSWHQIERFFPETGTVVEGINLVEFVADDIKSLNRQLQAFVELLDDGAQNPECVGYGLAKGHDDVKKIWAMRKKAVGLLGNAQGEARPIPFIEDTAVPPEKLADYIEELRALLDGYKLEYGMFGHVDAGVLHVRPAIDMKDPEQELLIREISDQVVELTQKYHGLFWGEHGKGVRSEYAPEYFGDLYPELQRIKAAFDPDNQLNPGKIATPDNQHALLKIDEVPTRGQSDRIIFSSNWQEFKEAVYCNGNGACHNWDPKDAMCPSWKATRERIHTPKGRASLLREWLKQLSSLGVDTSEALYKRDGLKKFIKEWPQRFKNTRQRDKGEYDFSHEVYQSMKACLSCKSCSGQCPIKVDVPSFKSKFLALYHTRYNRPIKDYMVGALEHVLPVAAKVPGVYNAMTQSKLARQLISKTLKFEDVPALSQRQVSHYIKHYRMTVATPKSVRAVPPNTKRKSLILVQDAFTSHFESELIMDIALLLRILGFNLLIAPYKPNGKPLHVHGFLGAFNKVANENVMYLQELAQYGIPLVGLDPAMTLSYRGEYTEAVDDHQIPQVMLFQEWLSKHSKALQTKANLFKPDGSFKLLPHCTEQSNTPETLKHWVTIFESLGQKLEVLKVGCCGMSGTYGHESENRESSAKIFQLSWRQEVAPASHQGVICATGYSCRSQSKREALLKVPHPLQLLLGQAKSQDNEPENDESVARKAYQM